MRDSGALLEATWDMDEDAVAAIARPRLGLRGWGGPILLACITYDRKPRRHTCRIEEAQRVRRGTKNTSPVPNCLPISLQYGTIISGIWKYNLNYASYLGDYS